MSTYVRTTSYIKKPSKYRRVSPTDWLQEAIKIIYKKKYYFVWIFKNTNYNCN